MGGSPSDDVKCQEREVCLRLCFLAVLAVPDGLPGPTVFVAVLFDNDNGDDGDDDDDRDDDIDGDNDWLID